MTDSRSFLTGTIPTIITMGAGDTVAWLILQTDDDKIDESSGTVYASIRSGTGYRVGRPSLASVLVLDNDEPKLSPPPAPSNFRVTSADKSSISLRWNAVSGTYRYWLEYRARGETDWDHS